MIAVNLRQLSKKYGRRIGISGINLTIEEGDIFGLIGPDGAGKSTILRILMNYIIPSDGEAEVFDFDAEDDSKQIKKDTAYVPAEVYFYNRMKAGKYIGLTMKAHHHKKDERFKEIMAAFEVTPKERFENMDRSEQKKTALAAAIAAEPRLLLLDEPLRGLDATVQNRLFDYLLELQDNGSTILITGRDADEIAPICNAMAVIENGEITVTPEEFSMDHPAFREDPILPDAEDELFDDDEQGNTIVISPEKFPTEEIPVEAPPVVNAPIIDTPIVDVPIEDAPTEAIPAAPEEEEAPPEISEEEISPEEPKEKESENAPQKKPTEKEKAKAIPNAVPAREKEYKNITMHSVGFRRKEFEAIGAKVVSEENGKIILEYSGDMEALAKLLYDLNMDDIRLSSKDLQDVFMPFYEGSENE